MRSKLTLSNIVLKQNFNQAHRKIGLFAKSKGEIQYFVLSQFTGKLSKIKQTVLGLPKPF